MKYLSFNANCRKSFIHLYILGDEGQDAMVVGDADFDDGIELCSLFWWGKKIFIEPKSFKMLFSEH